MRAIASPMPLDAPVTIAARCAMALLLGRRRMWRGIPSLVPRLGPACIDLSRSSSRCSRPARSCAGCGGSEQARQTTARSPSRPASRPTSRRPAARRSTTWRRWPTARARSSRPASRCCTRGPTASASRSSTPPASRSPAPRWRSTPPAPTARACAGPYVARSESLAVKPQFQSQTVAPGPQRGQVRLRRRRALQAQRQAGRRGASPSSTGACW